MKKEDWYKTLNLAEDRYLAEAEPGRRTGRKRSKKPLYALIAAAACLALVIGWLFMPFASTLPDVTRYADSEYYSVIEKLNEFTWERPKYNNNFEVLSDRLVKMLNFGMKGAAPGWKEEVDAMPDEENIGATYEEVTDNQVEGVVEADRIKRSDKYIYYLDNQIMRVFSIAGLDSKELGNINLAVDIGGHLFYQSKWEFYLSQDCQTATVVLQYLTKDREPVVGVISLDVSDPANMAVKNRVEMKGSYLSSRMTEGKLLVLVSHRFDQKEIDFNDETSFLPQVDTGKGMEMIPAEDIIVPEEVNSTRYTIVMKLDEETLEAEGTAAYLSYTEDVYVSREHLFLTRVFADVSEDKQGRRVRNAMTEISCLTYGGSTFEKKGAVTVRGYVKDQWSMDEYEGILRVVTTTNATVIHDSYPQGGGVSVDSLLTATGASNASLYCVDLGTFQIVAAVEDFAPPYEEVQSVRFDKDTAYVCTSIEMSDPVFFFDLSDLENITYKDTGTIEGFSTSLVNFGNGNLLGIGVGDWSTVKVEIYEETADGVVGFCKYEIPDASYSTTYKSYYIDRENQLIGFGVYMHISSDNIAGRYIVLFFDGYELVELANVPLMGEAEFQRGVYVDDYMYMFGSEDFKVEKLFK